MGAAIGPRHVPRRKAGGQFAYYLETPPKALPHQSPSSLLLLTLSWVNDGDSCQVFIADSESSTIREMSLVGKGPTRTLVGGSGVNPDNLFAFGDKDGKVSHSTAFQHSMLQDDSRMGSRVL